LNPLDRTNLIASQQKTLDTFQTATRYDIELSIDESLTSFTGYQKVFYTNNEIAPLDKLFFNLVPNTSGDYLQVKNIQIDDSQIKGSLTYLNSALEINLEDPIQPGESIQVSMDFSGKVPEQMGGNYGLYIYQHEILALDSFFPIIPVYEEGSWKVQDPPHNADLIYTDAAFFKVRVEAPKRLVLVSSGSEIDKQIIKDRQIITFAGGPQRDFYLAASPRFKETSRIDGEWKISSFYPEEFRPSGEMVLETTVKAMRVFSERYGPFPYTEYDLVSTPMQAGGMEYSGVAAMAFGLYGAGNTASGSPNSDFLEFATAHEAAHQWFFNQVMNNQIKEPWLDEGLAQYLTYVYYLDTYGTKAADQIRSIFEGYWSRAGNAHPHRYVSKWS
jgi:aminopeptidase N